MARPPIEVTVDLADLSAFVADFEMVTAEGIELPSPFARDPGEKVRFVVRTLDRRVVLEGTGVVADVVDNGRMHPPDRRYELAIAFEELSATSHVVLERIQMARDFSGTEPTGVHKLPADVVAARAAPTARPAPTPYTPAPRPAPAPQAKAPPSPAQAAPLFPRSSVPEIRERVTSTGDLLEEVDEADFLTPPPRPLPKMPRAPSAPPPLPPRVMAAAAPAAPAPKAAAPAAPPAATVPVAAAPAQPHPVGWGAAPAPGAAGSDRERRTMPPAPTKAAPVPRTVGKEFLPPAPRRRTGQRPAVTAPPAPAEPAPTRRRTGQRAAVAPAPAEAEAARPPVRKKTLPGGVAVDPAKPRRRTGARPALAEPEAPPPRRRRTGQRAAVPLVDERGEGGREEDATDRVPILPPRK